MATTSIVVALFAADFRIREAVKIPFPLMVQDTPSMLKESPSDKVPLPTSPLQTILAPQTLRYTWVVLPCNNLAPVSVVREPMLYGPGEGTVTIDPESM